MKKILHLGKWFIVLSLAVGLFVTAGCSSSSTPTSTTPTPPVSTTLGTTSPATTPSGRAITIALTAKSISFDKNSITVPAGAQVTINFDNADTGIPHNFALYTDSSANTSIFVGQTINGPATMSYQFTAPTKPGTYFFRCDIHPTIMTGSFIVQ